MSDHLNDLHLVVIAQSYQSSSFSINIYMYILCFLNWKILIWWHIIRIPHSFSASLHLEIVHIVDKQVCFCCLCFSSMPHVSYKQAVNFMLCQKFQGNFQGFSIVWLVIWLVWRRHYSSSWNSFTHITPCLPSCTYRYQPRCPQLGYVWVTSSSPSKYTTQKWEEWDRERKGSTPRNWPL